MAYKAGPVGSLNRDGVLFWLKTMQIVLEKCSSMASRQGPKMRRPFQALPKRFFKIYLSLIFGVLSVSCPLSAQDIKTVSLVSFDYPPFYFLENDEVRGIGTDLVTEVFRRLGIKHVLTMYPLKRALLYLESAQADGLMILLKTPEREKYLSYTEPVITVRGLIWSAASRNGGPVEFEELTDLKLYSIGITRGYSYGVKLDRILKEMPQVEIANTDLQNYRKLIGHRIEIFPGNEIVARGLFKQHPELKGKVRASQKSFIEWTFHMGVAKQSPLVSLIPQLNQIIAELQKEGFIQASTKKYTE